MIGVKGEEFDGDLDTIPSPEHGHRDTESVDRPADRGDRDNRQAGDGLVPAQCLRG
jgi:hypothetical protein